jgi:hypothetical protein
LDLLGCKNRWIKLFRFAKKPLVVVSFAFVHVSLARVGSEFVLQVHLGCSLGDCPVWLHEFLVELVATVDETFDFGFRSCAQCASRVQYPGPVCYFSLSFLGYFVPWNRCRWDRLHVVDGVVVIIYLFLRVT